MNTRCSLAALNWIGICFNMTPSFTVTIQADGASPHTLIHGSYPGSGGFKGIGVHTIHP